MFPSKKADRKHIPNANKIKKYYALESIYAVIEKVIGQMSPRQFHTQRLVWAHGFHGKFIYFIQMIHCNT